MEYYNCCTDKELILNGLICSICGKPQFDSPSGTVCENGHGGVEGLIDIFGAENIEY